MKSERVWAWQTKAGYIVAIFALAINWCLLLYSYLQSINFFFIIIFLIFFFVSKKITKNFCWGFNWERKRFFLLYFYVLCLFFFKEFFYTFSIDFGLGWFVILHNMKTVMLIRLLTKRISIVIIIVQRRNFLVVKLMELFNSKLFESFVTD